MSKQVTRSASLESGVKAQNREDSKKTPEAPEGPEARPEVSKKPKEDQYCRVGLTGLTRLTTPKLKDLVDIKPEKLAFTPQESTPCLNGLNCLNEVFDTALIALNQ